MMPMMMPPAQAIAEILGVAAAGPIKVLDIAAGHGIFGIVLAQRNPQAEIVAVDWAGVLEVATENAAKMGVAARHQAMAGDAFTVGLGRRLRRRADDEFPPSLRRRDLHDAAEEGRGVAEAGGRVAVLEFVPNDDRISPPRIGDVRDADARRHAVGRRLHLERTDVDAEGRGLHQRQRSSAAGPQTVVVRRPRPEPRKARNEIARMLIFRAYLQTSPR